MLKCKAIDKLKDSRGITIGYTLTDGTTTMSVKSKDIKNAIMRGDVEIENLQLTSDGKLIAKSSSHGIPSKNNGVAKSTPSKKKPYYKYNKLSYLKQVKVNKNTQTGYTNYSDAYDFHSPMQSFSYDLPIVDYEGYIKDKKNNVYIVKARYKSEDSGRITGGASDYRVQIQYNDKIITLSGHSSAFGSHYGTRIIFFLENGYYLEDYLTICNEDDAIIDDLELVKIITKDNVYNKESECAKERRLKEEAEKKFKDRYVEHRFEYKIIVTLTEKGYKQYNWDKELDIHPDIAKTLAERHPEVKIGESIALEAHYPKQWKLDRETNQLVIIPLFEYKLADQTKFSSKTILNMLADTGSQYKNYVSTKLFCITGKLKYFKNREQLLKFIKDNDMKYTDSIPKYLDYLITNDINSTSNKITKVKEINSNKSYSEKGIGIMSEERFIVYCRKIDV